MSFGFIMSLMIIINHFHQRPLQVAHQIITQNLFHSLRAQI